MDRVPIILDYWDVDGYEYYLIKNSVLNISGCGFSRGLNFPALKKNSILILAFLYKIEIYR